jgi:putative PIN family toxin of toxin-antitoxin system
MNRHFVLDNNILVSALLVKNSAPFWVIKKVEEMGVILYSEATLLELNQVLNRKKFIKYFTVEEKQEFIVKLNKVWIGYSVFINVSLYLKIIADMKALYSINIKDKKKTSINTLDQDNKRDEFYQNREFKTFETQSLCEEIIERLLLGLDPHLVFDYWQWSEDDLFPCIFPSRKAYDLLHFILSMCHRLIDYEQYVL